MAFCRTREDTSNLPRDLVAVDPESAKDTLFIVDRLLEPQTIPHFLEFINHGKLPDGKKTSLPLLSTEEVMLITIPYKDWASPPHNDLSESASYHMTVRIGSYEDSSRLSVVEKSVHAMKSRLWEGIIPMSQTRWRQKRLHEPEGFRAACQHLAAVIETFSYLNMPQIQRDLRDTFNLISGHLSDFEAAINSLRTTQHKEPLSVTALWEEFIRTTYQVMTTRAHGWILSHIKELREPILQQPRAHQPPSEDIFSPEQWTLTNKLHDLTELAARADYTIFMPMHGYTGYSPPASGPAPELHKRREFYSPRLKSLTRMNMIANLSLERPKPLAHPERLVQRCTEQTQAQDQVRRELRGEPEPLAAEQWILDLKRSLELAKEENPAGSWGFVAYRLTYKETDEEWTAFLQKLEAHVSDWGEGVAGAEDIKAGAKLLWLDGKEHGIPEGDIDAAKKHFTTFRTSPALTPGFQSDVFLAIDSLCVSSYSCGPISSDVLPPGDVGGFVLAVDAAFDPDEPNEHADESPGYAGQMRILSSLVWSDLYALMAAQTQFPGDLWPLAMEHPSQVYVGPTVPVQREKWRETRRIRDLIFREFVRWVRENRTAG